MKKKIIHITQSNGGVSIYLQMLLKYFDKNKYEQILICPESYLTEKEKFSCIIDKIEYVDMVREINLLKDLKSIVKINELVKRYNPDLIYVHSSKAGALGRIANIFNSKHIIYNPHGWAFNMRISNIKRKVYLLIEKILAIRTDKIIAISEAEKESAIKNRICNPEKIEVIFNGIDIEEYKNKNIGEKITRNTLDIPSDAYIIGMVGRISMQKSPDIFVKSAYEIKKKIPNSFFIIVGDGEERQKIEELIEKLNLSDSFLITGWIDETYDYIKLFDVAMLLSKWEGFGLAIVEYMISEKPIVATNIDAIPNLIEDKKDGLLVEVDDIDSIVECVLTLKENKSLSEKLVNNALIKVNKSFSVKRVVKEHEGLLEKIL